LIVGYLGVQKFIKENPAKSNEDFIIISTAHPAKFYQTMNKTNVPYKIPEKINKLLQLEGNKRKLKNDYNCWKEPLKYHNEQGICVSITIGSIVKKMLFSI
jgi:threonine synthase